MEWVNYTHWMRSLSQSHPPTPIPKWQIKPETVQFWKTIRSHIEYFAYSYNHKLPMPEFPQLHSSVCRPEETSPAQYFLEYTGEEFEKCPKWQMWKILIQDSEDAFAAIPHLLIALLLNFWTKDAGNILDWDTQELSISQSMVQVYATVRGKLADTREDHGSKCHEEFPEINQEWTCGCWLLTKLLLLFLEEVPKKCPWRKLKPVYCITEIFQILRMLIQKSLL